MAEQRDRVPLVPRLVVAGPVGSFMKMVVLRTKSPLRPVPLDAPELFLPQYGGYCAYAVSKGKLVTVDPDVYVVLDEKLFLFSNAEARTAFESEEPGIVQVADGKWAEMESERAQKKGCFSCF